MKALIGFLFFMLFLAGLAFVNLRNSQETDVLQISSAAELIDNAWKLTHLGEMIMGGEAEIYIQFREDGQFSGSAGCNRFFGQIELTDPLIFGGVGATRRACPEPLNSYEFTFLEALAQASKIVRRENRIAFRNTEDQSILRFVAMPRIDE